MALGTRRAPLFVIGAMAICAFIFVYYFKGNKSEIIISDSINDFVDKVDSLPFLPPEKLILVDIDDTTFQSTKLIGTPTWYYHVYNVIRQNGASKFDAKKIVGHIDKRVQEHIDVIATEDAIISAIHRWQDQGVLVIGITSRPGTFAHITERQLRDVGLDFSRTSFACLEQEWDKNWGDFLNNILYVGDLLTKAKVADSLVRTAKLCGYPIRLIAQADDQQRYIREGAKIAEINNINYVGIIYDRARSRVFDLKKANDELLELEAVLDLQIMPDRFRNLFHLP